MGVHDVSEAKEAKAARAAIAASEASKKGAQVPVRQVFSAAGWERTSHFADLVYYELTHCGPGVTASVV